jgi:hypothetical protein
MTAAPSDQAARMGDGLAALPAGHAQLFRTIAASGGVFRTLGAGVEPTWHLLRSPDRVDATAVRALIDAGWLLPLGDSLIPGDSQTYVPKFA